MMKIVQYNILLKSKSLEKCVTNITRIILFVFLLILVFPACKKESSYTITLDTLSVNPQRDSGYMQIVFTNTNYPDITNLSMKYSVTDKKGTVLFNLQTIPLIDSGMLKYASIPIPLRSGYFICTDCRIFDSKNNQLYAMQGKSIEYKIVRNFIISIYPNFIKTYSKPIPPPDSLYFSAYIFNLITKKFELCDAQITVKSNNILWYSANLQSTVNAIAIPDSISNWTITTEKNGYKNKVDTFYRSDLQLYKPLYPFTVFLEEK